jgi:hypothetical protein
VPSAVQFSATSPNIPDKLRPLFVDESAEFSEHIFSEREMVILPELFGVLYEVKVRINEQTTSVHLCCLLFLM